MAFPSVASKNNSYRADIGTSHTVNLPAGIQAGNLLLVFFALRVTALVTITFPEGWTKIAEIMDYRSEIGIAWREADGNEGATITVTTSSSLRSAHISYRITGATDPDTQAPEVSTGASGSSANPDPDSLTPTGGVKDYLWIALDYHDGGTIPVTGYPANYNDNQEYRDVPDQNYAATLGIATRELNASSEDPGTFTLSSSRYWGACTVAVHPTGVAAVAPTAALDGPLAGPLGGPI